MGTPRQRKFVNRTDVAATAIGATQPSATIIDNQFPTGDLLLKALNVNLQGTMSLTTSAPGTINTRGGLIFLRSLRLETDKHGIIINGIPGNMLHDMNAIRNGYRGVNQDIASADTGSPTFAYNLKLEFEDRHGVRSADSILDLFSSRCRLTCQYGIAADLAAGGVYSTRTVDAARQELSVDILPGPIDVQADGPIMQPYWDLRRDPISSTATQFQIILPYGDRLVKRYYITQYNSSTLLPLGNTILGVNTTDRLSLKVNSFPWLDNVSWDSLQTEGSEDYGIVMPTGMGVVDFFAKRAGGPKLSDALNLVTNQNGMAEFFIDVTTVTNGELRILTEALKPLAPAAQRPAPTTQGK